MKRRSFLRLLGISPVLPAIVKALPPAKASATIPFPKIPYAPIMWNPYIGMGDYLPSTFSVPMQWAAPTNGAGAAQEPTPEAKQNG